ncbi:argininosuccinate synthase [Sulfidibacter corallicola]|uniref:argininosuccinate synthase n=1 Tax=Sulfidibacter corallicola TaxID=2818388 RepID=A0A8A4TK51_SULCO|nr:argininosuccinate synthase [Sulfidibacter corallicola]QTD50316.1 argininosuccinate synthase [Sulfidibacter corallicola]
MKVILAYSGGLDTSASVIWLKRVKKFDQVVAVLVDVGQRDDFDALRERALMLGADDVVVVDQKSAMCEQGIAPMLKVGATYEGSYLLGTAIARPFIADAMVEAALETGAGAICHGATGKGNDYLRFEQRIKVLAPGIQIISPWREWACGDREQALALIADTGVSIPAKSFDYSIDANLWHTSYEGGSLEDLSQAPPPFFREEMHKEGVAEVQLVWEKGLPVALNGRDMPLAEMIPALNELLAPTAYGWLDLLETRTNGLKSRGIYHTPAGTLLYEARTALSQCWLAKPSLDFLEGMGQTYGKFLYEGIWQHPVQHAIEAATDALFAETQGTIDLVVKGAKAQVLARTANPNCFASELGGFGHMDSWNAAYSEALVFFQHLKYHSLPAGVGIREPDLAAI